MNEHTLYDHIKALEAINRSHNELIELSAGQLDSIIHRDHFKQQRVLKADKAADFTKLGIHTVSMPRLQALYDYIDLLAWFGFKCTQNVANCCVELSNEYYSIKIEAGAYTVYKRRGAKVGWTGMFQLDDLAVSASQLMCHLVNQVDYGTHYIYVAGMPVAPLQQFSELKTKESITGLAMMLQQANAQLAYKSDKVFRWVSKAGEVEIKQSSLTSTVTVTTQTEEKEEEDMNVFDLIAGEALYEVKVTFEGTPNREYSYKSEVAYEAGQQVVVETPSTGLSGGDFPKYKWVVGALDTKRYKELLAKESETIAKIAAFKRAAAARKELEALGLTAAEVLEMLGLASKAE